MVNNVSDFLSQSEIALTSNTDVNDLWHRCGHLYNQAPKQLVLPTLSTFCEVCTYPKLRATSVGKILRKREPSNGDDSYRYMQIVSKNF